MLHTGTLVDGRRGGLVVGPSHEEGFIYLVYEDPATGYGVAGTMEGGEYLLCSAAYHIFHRRIDQINSWEQATSPLEKITISRGTRVLNTYGPYCDGAILIDAKGQFVVNKFATSRFFEEIEGFNQRGGVSVRR